MIGYPIITFIYPLEFKAKKAYYKNLYSLLRTTYVAGWIGRCNFFYRHSLQPLPPPPSPVNSLWKAILCSYYCWHHWRLHLGGPKCLRLKKKTESAFYCLLRGARKGGYSPSNKWISRHSNTWILYNLPDTWVQVYTVLHADEYPKLVSGVIVFLFLFLAAVNETTCIECFEVEALNIFCKNSIRHIPCSSQCYTAKGNVKYFYSPDKVITTVLEGRGCVNCTGKKMA